MDKKIYVLKSGDNPGIYFDWLSFFENALGQYVIKHKIIIYKTEFEKADKSVPYSKEWALERAKEFLEGTETVPAKKAEQKEPFHTKAEQNRKDTQNTKDTHNTKDAEETEKELRKLLGIREDLHMGSVWLDLLLQLVGEEKPRISGKNYTGRYNVMSLYGMLLFLILEPQQIFDEAYLKLDIKSKPETALEQTRWRETLEFELFRAKEYLQLKERFEAAGLTKLDINDVKYRIIEITKSPNQLCKESKTYFSMYHFIKQGNHTLVDLYNELMDTKIYREELIRISGAMINLELMGEIPSHRKKEAADGEETFSLSPLVKQTKELRQELKNVIIGQDEAIDKFEQSFFHSEKAAVTSKKQGPRSVFLFAGPPGVGKTYMAETFAKALGMTYHRFDMASYGSINAMEEIVGISSFYTNSKPGVLTSFVKENPKSVLLFDEIEKASIGVIRIFLQILDQGQCLDRNYDENVSFKDCIIIMTTNAGKQLYNNAGNKNLTEIPDRVVIDALEKDINPDTKVPYFPPEIVSRMASYSIIMFNHLKAAAIRQVIKRDIEQNLLQNKQNYGFDISKGSDIVAATVQYAVGGGGDARNASKLSGKLIDKELYELFSLMEEKAESGEKPLLNQVSWECDFTDCTEEIRQFYLGEQDCIVPILKETDREYAFSIPKRMTIIVTNNKERFLDIIRSKNVLFAVIDYAYGLRGLETCMSIADVKTTGSSAFDSVKKEESSLPVYLLKNDARYHYSDSEKRLLLGKGAEGFISEEKLTEQITQAYFDICCQNAMETLTVRHQVLTYSTRKEMNDSKTSAKIIFYNLKLEMAVDAEDKESLITDELRPDKKWTDVYVSPDIKKELEFFISYLKNPKEYAKTGARVPRGALMLGLPGTGKTSLAKVVAAESKVNFLSISADELLNAGAAKVHHVFQVARKYAPAVLFIDEVDAIGMARTKTGANSVLNALLTEMDGFKRLDNKPVFVMAATNLKGIDSALARRFDRTFIVELPDANGRRWILDKLLAAHEEWFAISEKEKEGIIARSDGLSAADLENIIEMALREGIRNGKAVSDVLLDEMFEMHNHGEKREQSSEKEVEQTAYHEAGHAMTELFYGRCPEYMSVVARADFNGYVKSEKMSEHPTKERLLQEICTCMGGRAAELEFGYGKTPGASADLRMATRIAVRMVCEFGMYEEEIGLAVITEEEYRTDQKAKQLVNKILKEQLETAAKIVAENRNVLTALVRAVLENEQKFLTKKDIMDIYESRER